LKLALDTQAPGFQSVVSHAHGDHIPWEAHEAWASPETKDLLGIRKPDLLVHEIPWGEATRVGAARVTLHPAGHILGSALTLIEAPSGETLLYTADTKVREGLTTPLAEFSKADTLIVESTFGLPIYHFPPTEALRERAVRWAKETLAEGEVPVFLGYALGKSQEILAILRDGGVPTIAHGAVWNMCQVYERDGVHFPTTRPYVPGEVEGAALVVPGSFAEHPMITKLDARIAYCSGWAMLSKSRIQMDADLLLPLSDHADFPELLEIVRRVRPEKVYANHGYADILTHLLRKDGHDASALDVGHGSAEDEDASQARLGGLA
jgi:Cft2 family RNA processing exonuclease